MMSEAWHLKRENQRKDKQIAMLEQRCRLLAHEIAVLNTRLDSDAYEAHWDGVILGGIRRGCEGGEGDGESIRCRDG